jgi:UTP--glucose-1-phosphate uridylyltransferase
LTKLKAVIPAAGLGTRLLSATKEQPKEMLPIFAKGSSGELCTKPIVQVIYEQLFDYGIREFFFIVGRSKRAIEDHFTPDYSFVDSLNSRGKSSYAKDLSGFYEKLSTSNIVWINQHTPLGFGHAVLMVKNLIKDDTFLVHAGDTIISSHDNSHIHKLVQSQNKLSANATLLVRHVDDPRQFGVVVGQKQHNIIHVEKLEEKPAHQVSSMAILPAYVFEPSIFSALERVAPGKGNEIQLTDGIMKLVESKNKVIAVEMDSSHLWIDVGNPESYYDALTTTYKSAKQS